MVKSVNNSNPSEKLHVNGNILTDRTVTADTFKLKNGTTLGAKTPSHIQLGTVDVTVYLGV